MDPVDSPAPASELNGLVVRFEGQRIREILEGLPVGKLLSEHAYVADEKIFGEGTEGHKAFLLLEGTVLIEKKRPKGPARQLARFQEGDVFGEMALLDGPIRSATARAGAQGARVLAITKNELDRIFTQAPKVARWLLKVLSHRLRIATKMTAEMEQVQSINRRIIDGQDQERRRIARDIHDGPAQQYADYVMRLQIVTKLIDRDPGEAKGEIANLRSSIEEGLDHLRKLIHNLHTKDTQATGLETAVRKFVGRLSQDATFKVSFDFDDDTTSKLADHLKTTVYCLVQEAMNNIRKHARASRVEVRLQPLGEGASVLEIEDDGIGFDVDGLLSDYHTRESLGMTSMKERCELAGGRMTIDSAAGKGTVLSFSFPISPADAKAGEDRS